MLFRSPDVSKLAPVVIMSRGHSGTRVLSFLCEKLGANMGADDDLTTGDVADLAFSGAIKKLARRGLRAGSLRDVSDGMRRGLARAIDGYHQRLGRPAGLWGWKFPETYLLTTPLAATLPKVRMLHMVRDGRDIAFKRHLTDDPGRRLGRAVLKAVGAVDRPRFEQAALSWAAQVDAFDAAKRELPAGALHELTFESLCTYPELELDRLAEFLGTPVTDEALRFAREDIRPSKVGQHRENDPTEVARVEQLIGPTLARWGYASSPAAGAGSRETTRS